MADDKSKTGGGDRKRVAEDQGYEVGYFARKHGLTTEEAREIIQRVGNDRDKLNAEVAKKGTGTPNGRRTKPGRAGQNDHRDGRAKIRGSVSTTRNSPVAKTLAVGGAVAAGLLLWSRRDQIGDQIGKLAEGVSGRRQGIGATGDAAADRTSGQTLAVSPELGTGNDSRTQAEIAEEALTLKETARPSPA